ncbi:MAG: hypothetical protein QOE03_873 [Micromonosporaceae bacterium]|nr:hypothetical protein [Micromonosporaceae bacterium]
MPTTPHEATDAGPARDRPVSAVPAQRGARGTARPVAFRRAPVALAAGVTTLWAAVVSLAPVVTVVVLAHLITGAGAPVGQVLRVALAGWLLAHGVDLHTPTGPLGLAPLAFTLLAAWRVARAGVHTTRAIGGRRRGSPRLAVLAATAVGVGYGLLGAAVARLAALPGLTAPVATAGLTLAGFGFIAAMAGAIVESGLPAKLARRTPIPLRDATRTGVVAALLVLGAGAAAAGTSLALNGGAASRILAAYHAGATGQAGLTLICLVYGPNLAVWAASYLIGPGFMVGAGTMVSFSRVSLDAVPAVPVLAAVPARPAAGWAALLLAVPLAAGMAAGCLLARRRLRAEGRAEWSAAVPVAPSAGAPPPATADVPSAGWLPLLGAAVLAGPVAGIALAAVASASAGPLGGGHLAEVGPHPWPLAGVAAGLVAVGAVVGVAATRALTGVRRKRA